MRLLRIVLGFSLPGVIVAAADAAGPPVHPAMPAPPHFAAGVGPGVVGGPAKQQTGIVIGKPILRHH